MEYFVGAVLTLVAVAVTRFFVAKDNEKSGGIEISYSQSNVYNLIRPFLPEKLLRQVPPSQSSKHYDKIFTKILIDGDSAYWIKDNTFFTAAIIDGDIDKESAKQVDTMAMDKVQLDKMIKIIETLTKGNFNDYRNSE